jgi:hypothetical protein
METPKPKFRPIILDRTRLEQAATCPLQCYLSVIFDALKAKETGYEVHDWEQKILDSAPPELIERMTKVAKQSTMGRLAECGIEIHKLIDRALEECANDLQIVPGWFVDNLPTIKPNISAMAERHARHVADMMADYHVSIIGSEMQISMVIIDETETTPAIIGTTCIDLLGSGKGNLHVADWKTGFKRRSNSETLDSFQARFICLLLFCQPEYAEVHTIHFWYYETMFGTKSYARFDRNEEHPRLPGLSTEVALKGQAKEAALVFQSGCKDAWPMPESCDWCDVIRFCPYASMDVKEIADNPKDYVDRLIVLQALCTRMKKAATGYCKGHGPIVGTKSTYAMKQPSNKFTCGIESNEKPLGPVETGNSDLDSHFSEKY